MTKGKPWSEEIRKKLSEAHKGKHSPMKGKKTGKPSWNKGKKGVQIAWNKGKHPSPETLKKLSESHKGQIPWIFGKHQSEEAKMKMSLGHKGKPAWNIGKSPSEETIRKQKETLRKTVSNYTLEVRKRLNEAIKRGQSNPEVRKKLREASKKLWENPEFRKRQIETHKGKPSGHKGKIQSEESRRKMSETKKKLFSEGKIIAWNIGKSPSEETIRKLREVNKNRMSNPEIRKRISEESRKRILKAYESGAFPRQENTKPERQIKEELLKRGYIEGKDFIHQYKFMNKFMCDFCFPQQKVVVEAYGDFWHANPKKYLNQANLHVHQIKGIGRDKSKEGYITTVDNRSWTFLILWESDIKKDVSKCVDLIEQALKKTKQTGVNT